MAHGIEVDLSEGANIQAQDVTRSLTVSPSIMDEFTAKPGSAFLDDIPVPRFAEGHFFSGCPDPSCFSCAASIAYMGK